jgi:heparanase 1
LWRKFMGTKVLDAGSAFAPNVYVYAHCLRNRPGGVALLIINANRSASQELTLPTKSSRYTLTASDLLSGEVQLNGMVLMLNAQGDVPSLDGIATAPGKILLPPASITFFGVAGDVNPVCRMQPN